MREKLIGERSSFDALDTFDEEILSEIKVSVDEMMETMSEKTLEQDEQIFVDKLYDFVLREEDFCSVLKFALTKYKTSLLFHAKLSLSSDSEPEISSDDVNLLFGNLENVQNLSKKLSRLMYISFNDVLTSKSEFGKEFYDLVFMVENVLLKLSEKIDIFSEYCLNLKQSLNIFLTLKSKNVFETLRKSIQLPSKQDFGVLCDLNDEKFAMRFDLENLLLAPLIHICQYSNRMNSLVRSFRALIKNVACFDEDVENPNFEALNLVKSSLEKSQTLCKSWNKLCKQKYVFWKEYHKVKAVFERVPVPDCDPDLHPDRRLLREEKLFVVIKVRNLEKEFDDDYIEEHTLFLFNDVMLLAQIGNDEPNLKFRFCYDLSRVFVKEIRDKSAIKSHVCYFPVWGKTMDSAGSLTQQGFEFHFRDMAHCEKLHSMLLKLKKLRDANNQSSASTNKKESGMSNAQIYKTRRQRFKNRKNRKKGSLATLSTTTTTRTTRKQSTSSVASLCYPDFHPVYVDKNKKKQQQKSLVNAAKRL